ncbi:MAG: hypothetical protein QME78_16735 [Thermodesulfobacteriota bacterium]|nr:hypothetical protein [Thermodesulfobacteriota bacterium]
MTKPIFDLSRMTWAVLINGRSFIEKTSLGEWLGFRWGRAEISVQTSSKYFPERVLTAHLYLPNDAWALDFDWTLKILRNLDTALDEKLRVQEKRQMEEEERLRQAKATFNATQKFYGILTLKELPK